MFSVSYHGVRNLIRGFRSVRLQTVGVLRMGPEKVVPLDIAMLIYVLLFRVDSIVC